ncbi:MAG: putative methyltransferase [Flavipsychrobacter sp.]|jgi:2-polyprenyl-3-methyl-5-hydroxy-6-metoxy-1,4-benzoquinol methylase|nr:putative methyltransferase [Flavipsychrobacter sp.]
MAVNSSSVSAKIISFIKRKTSQQYRFNQQYSGTYWDGLRNIEDLGRYSVIVGYIRFFFKHARILDLGCGEGILRERLSPSDFAYYLGVDISDVAIANAQKNADAKTGFITGDIGKLDLDEPFDAIVYNESLYYLKNPKASVMSLFKNLSKDGIFIISSFNKHGKENVTMWNTLSEILVLKDRATITNAKGDWWTIHIYTVKR